MRNTLTLGLAIAITAAGLAYILMPAESALDAFSYDSYRYLAGAESILRDGTYRDLAGEPQRIWPPGVSLLYAGLASVSGVSPERLVPFVNGVSYTVTAVLLWLLARAVGMRWWTAGAMLAAALLNSAVLAAHRKLWSEPPVLTLLAGILLCLAAAKSERLLIAATVLASIAIVFRFAMLAAIPFLCIAFIVLAKRKVLAVVPLLAVVPWWIAAWLLGAPPAAARASSFRPVSWSENFPAIRALADQFFPARLLGSLAILLTLAVVVYAAVSARRERPLGAIAVAWVLCYGAFLLVAQAVASPSFTLDLRILLPMYVGIVVAIAAAIEAAASRSVIAAAVLAVPLILVPVRGARQFIAPSSASVLEATGTGPASASVIPP